MTTERAAPRHVRRRTTATLSRIVLAGASASTMFGLVAVMGATDEPSGPAVAPDGGSGPVSVPATSSRPAAPATPTTAVASTAASAPRPTTVPPSPTPTATPPAPLVTAAPVPAPAPTTRVPVARTRRS